MEPESIAVVEGADLTKLSADLAWAVAQGRTVRFTVEEGLKIDASDGGGWALPFGRVADKTGR